MKTLKMLIVLSLAAVVLILTANTFAAGEPNKAGKKPDRERARERMVDRLQQMSHELNLTEEQKTQIKPILDEEMEKMKALRSDTSLTPEQRQSTVRDIRMAAREKISPILTEEQKTKFRKEVRNQPMGQQIHRAANRLERMEKQLNLTEDQKKSIAPILDEQTAKIAELADSNLPDEQRRGKIKEVMKTHEDKIDQILTSEQKEKRNQTKDIIKERQERRKEQMVNKTKTEPNFPKK